MCVVEQIPVIFEGDFWAEEAVRLARAVDRKDETADDGLSPLELCRWDLLTAYFNFFYTFVHAVLCLLRL